jgi:hypothetical protein
MVLTNTFRLESGPVQFQTEPIPNLGLLLDSMIAGLLPRRRRDWSFPIDKE